MDKPQMMYYLVVAGSILIAFVTIRLRDSRLGRQWMAMREDEDVAEAMGINLVQTKLLAFSIGAAFSAMAGAVFAARVGNIFPHSFNLMISINALALIIVGGLGTVLGSVLGALFMTFLPEAVRVGVHSLSAVLPAFDVQAKGAFVEGGVYGLVIVLFLMFKPEGLARFWRDIVTYFRSWPFTY